MAKTLVGRVASAEHAQRVVDELVQCGVRRADIGLMTQGPHSELTGAAGGGTVITVEPGDETAARSALRILQKHGAVQPPQ